MEPPDKRLTELTDIVKSWIPRRSDSTPTNVSRDFWMPDQSCRVCYDCDSQFTIFNRRHHCRRCGRVFCAKCTSNSVPASPTDPKNVRDEAERLRVCNYCFKQWEQERAADTAVRPSSPVLSPSLSTTSLASTKSSGTGNSSTITASSIPYSTGGYQHPLYGSASSPGRSVHKELCPDKQGMLIPGRNVDSVDDIGEPSPNNYGFCTNRSDDEDDEFGACFDSETQHFHTSDEYYGPIRYDEVDQEYSSNKMHASEENIDAKESCTSPRDNTEFHASLGVVKTEEEAGRDNSYECNASSSIYGLENADAEPVDFENNRLLWLPPDPEDEEDEQEAVLFDDDDDDATGEWGYLRSSNSFGSGEYRNRDRSTEEHRKVMKNVVDGHFRALIAQLLQVDNLPMTEEDDKESWLDIVTTLAWEVAYLLKPDTSKGGGMDPGGYVKIKCLACGHRTESMVVKGVICKKNVANRRMTSKIEKPRFLILGGALEYQRVTNLLSSFDTLLQQEMDHLKMAVAKIDAHHPNVLLVEKSVSRFAQDYLLAKNISLVLNIKRPLLERIARCTGAQIVPSIDQLSSQKLGHCDLFHVKKFNEEHESAGQGGKKMKTLMFFEGCPKPLGCTVLLKGASGDELKKVKHVVQYGVFAAYHLALETSFLADEGASLPELPLKSPITVALPDKPSKIDRSISTIPGFTIPASSKSEPTTNMKQPGNTSLSISTSGSSGQLEVTVPLQSSNNYYPEVSEFTSFSNPSNINGFTMGENNQAVHVRNPLASALSKIPSSSSPGYSPSGGSEKNKVGFVEPVEKSFRASVQKNGDGPKVPGRSLDSFGSFDIGEIVSNGNQIDIRQIVERNPAHGEFGTSHQDNNQKDAQTLLKEEFPPSPSDHQSIVVSLSSRCAWKGTVCERAHLFRIKYYGNFDKPLGRFLRDHLFDQNYRCRSCEMPSEAHVHCYTHRQGSLTISVRKLLDVLLPGERDGKIWMWHRCLRCPRVKGFPPATRRVVMSDAAWGLSFGKFLELSFSNHAAASRVASCGHSLHRDCLRFYGFGRMVACFRYASINLHSVYLPPSKLDFNYQHQEWIQNEANEVVDVADLLFSEVLNALRQIAEKRCKTGSPENKVKVQESRSKFVELEVILQKEKAEFEETLQKIVKKESKKGEPFIDILEVNKLRRQLLFQSFVWDQRLTCATGSDKSSHEVLAGFIAIHKEKLISCEKAGDLDLASKPKKILISSDISLSDSQSDEPLKEGICAIDHQGLLDHPNQPKVGQQRRDEHDTFSRSQSKLLLYSSKSSANQLDPLESAFVVRRVHSDGQFPVMTNLSDTLDAKWRGENGPAPAEASISNSSSPVQAISVAPDPEYSEGQGRDDEIHSFTSALAPRCGDGVEELSRWILMPFLDFYFYINKNLGNTTKFDALSEYKPVYISSFRELQRQGGLLLPIGVNDTVIPVYDDEPTSVISYALVSHDYRYQMSDDQEKKRYASDLSLPFLVQDLVNFQPFQLVDEMSIESSKSLGPTDDSTLSRSGSRNSMVVDPLTYTKAMHARISFTNDGLLGKVKYTVTCYYAQCFSSLRKACCPSELDFIRSLSRCKKWGAQGGKSNVFFAKSLDDRFIIKQVTKTELESFIKFAPEYFKYLSEMINTGSPTCLAKILGIYQVTMKQLKGGKETKMDVLVMENLLFRRSVTRLYDLKGSARSRYNSDSSGNNKVLLDQNLIELMPTSPIFVGNKAKRLLERAVWNDTAFLVSIYVMDYSLLVGVDEEKHELVLGIIDFMRQYTWDKHLETWVKASGILGGPKNAPPTVVSPMEYKKRFRKAMSAYFLVVPEQWSPPAIAPSKSQSELSEDNQQNVPIES